MAFFVLSRKLLDILCQRSFTTTHIKPSIYWYALACAIGSLRPTPLQNKKKSYPYVLILRLNCYRLRLLQTLPPVSLSDCIRLFAVVRHSVLRLMQPGSDIGGLFPLFILNFIFICETLHFVRSKSSL